MLQTIQVYKDDMITPSFIEVLESDTIHTKEAVENLKAKITVKSISKGEILVREGETNAYVFFVKSGLLRSYCYDSNGKLHIFKFGSEGWHLSGGAEIGAPNRLFIDALEDTVVEEMDLHVYINEFMPFEVKSINSRMAKIIRHEAALKDRILMLMSYSALERYEYFLEHHANLIQRVPQKMIASFLGITPEALSKAKRQKTEKK